MVIQSQGSLTFQASIFDMGSGVFVVPERLRWSTGGALIPVARGETSRGGHSCRSSPRDPPPPDCVAKKQTKKRLPFVPTAGPDPLNGYTWPTARVFCVTANKMSDLRGALRETMKAKQTRPVSAPTTVDLSIVAKTHDKIHRHKFPRRVGTFLREQLSL